MRLVRYLVGLIICTLAGYGGYQLYEQNHSKGMISGDFLQELAESGIVVEQGNDESGISSLLKTDLGTPTNSNILTQLNNQKENMSTQGTKTPPIFLQTNNSSTTLPSSLSSSLSPPSPSMTSVDPDQTTQYVDMRALTEVLPDTNSADTVAPKPAERTYIFGTSETISQTPQLPQLPESPQLQTSATASTPSNFAQNRSTFPAEQTAPVQPPYAFAVSTPPPSVSEAPVQNGESGNPTTTNFETLAVKNEAKAATVVIPSISVSDQTFDPMLGSSYTAPVAPATPAPSQVTRLPGIENELTSSTTSFAADSQLNNSQPQIASPNLAAAPSQSLFGHGSANKDSMGATIGETTPTMVIPQVDTPTGGNTSQFSQAPDAVQNMQPHVSENVLLVSQQNQVQQQQVTQQQAMLQQTPQPQAAQQQQPIQQQVAPTVVPPSSPQAAGAGAEQVGPVVAAQVAEIGNQLAQGDIAGGYFRLNDLYFSENLTPEERRYVGRYLDQVAVSIVFSKRFNIIEPLYTVRDGDTVESVALQYRVTPELLRKINQIPEKAQVTSGAQLKVVRGPLDVRIYPNERELVILSKGKYACRFPICIGFSYAGQRGDFAVQEKILNPEYNLVDRTENIPAGSPENPLGSRWIRFSQQYGNLGLHGTNRPECVGTAQKAGGVFGLRERDIAEVYDMLVVGSRVSVIR